MYKFGNIGKIHQPSFKALNDVTIAALIKRLTMSPLKLEYHNKPLKVSNEVIDAELKS